MTPHLLFLIPLTCALVIYMISFKEGKQICDNYILVSYLYALFYLALLSYFVTILLEYENKLDKIGGYGLFGILLLEIIAYVGLMFIPKEQILLKHFVSILYIIITSITLAVVFTLFVPGTLPFTLLMTMALFIILTLIAWKFQDKISSNITLIMLIVFILLAIIEFLISVFFPGSLLEKAIVLIVLLIICYLVLVKTKRMIENRDSCEKDGGPDYVQEGTSLLLTFQNLLLRILQLFGKRRR